MSEYISRESVKDVVRSGISTDTEADKEYVCNFIDSIPSADVRENIHAYWEDDREGFEHCHCSKCGQIIFSCQKWFKCCPRCMAVMDGEPKGEKGEI